MRAYNVFYSRFFLFIALFSTPSIFGGDHSTNTIVNSPVTIYWEKKIESEIVSSPILSNDRVITATSNRVFAFNCHNGKKIWTHRFKEPVYSLSIFNKTHVIVSTAKGLYALNMTNGGECWKLFTEGGIQSQAVFSNDTVYAADWFGFILAAHAQNGKKIWKIPIGDKEITNINCTNRYIIVTSRDCNIYAISIKTSSLKWKVETKGEVWSQPVIINDTTYIGSDDGYLYAIDAESGSLLWDTQLKSEIRAPISFKDSSIFAVTLKGDICSINKNTGKINWLTKKENITDLRYKPLITKEILYLGSGWPANTLSALSLEKGIVLLQLTTDGPVYCTPAITSELLIFSYNVLSRTENSNGHLRAIKIPEINK